MKTLWTLWLSVSLVTLAHAADFRTPVLLTSGGQSADPQMIKTLLTRDSIAFEFKPLATAADLEGKGSVIIVLGGSSKGLGAAKVSAEEETARISNLLAAAKEKKISVLAMHIGGKNRRGALSDVFNRIGAENANELMILTGGDDDLFFDKIAEEKKLPLAQADKIANLGPMLKAKFVPVAEPAKE